MAAVTYISPVNDSSVTLDDGTIVPLPIITSNVPLQTDIQNSTAYVAGEVVIGAVTNGGTVQTAPITQPNDNPL